MNKNNISINVTAKDMASSVLSKIKGGLKGFGSTLLDIGKIGAGFALGSIFNSIGDVIARGASGILDYAMNLEQVEISFKTMLGSGKKARQLITDIQDA